MSAHPKMRIRRVAGMPRLVLRMMACVGALTVATATAATCAADLPSANQVLQAVRQQSPLYFYSDGHSQIHVVSVGEPTPTWFVARLHADTTTDIAEIVLRQNNLASKPLMGVAAPSDSLTPGTFALPGAIGGDVGKR